MRDTTPASQSINARWSIAAGTVVAVFAVLCCLRLNETIYLDPDGADFMLLARSLVTGNGYRDISAPGWPIHTLRPIGFPLLLIPAALIAPYSVIAAKLIVVLFALLMLLALWRLAATMLGPAMGFIVLLLFATNPATLWYATDVCSEVPYAACTLSLLLVAVLGERAAAERAAGGRPIPTWVTRITGFVLLALTPLIRIVGLCASAAGLWYTGRLDLRTDRVAGGWRRWSVVGFVAVSLLPVLFWMSRNFVVGTEGGTYVALLARPRPGGWVAWSAGSLVFYADALAAYVFSSIPEYMGLVLVAATAVAMLRDRSGRGIGALVYSSLYFLVISLYPFRHPRLVWPLVPLVLLWCAPALFNALSWSFDTLRMKRAAMSVSLAGVAAAATWQTMICLTWVAAGLGLGPDSNLGWAHLAIPPVTDWTRAGLWLRDNTPPFATVLTRHKSLFLWSRRAQFQVQFESIGSAELQAAIRGARAHYLVMAGGDEGVAVPIERLASDPIYQFERTYDSGNVVIYRVAINRTGSVPELPVDFSPIIQRLEANGSAHEAIGRQFLRAHFLRRAGRAAEAMDLLQACLEKTPESLPIVLELATCSIDLGQYAQGISWYHRAEKMAGANQYANAISGGIAMAEQLQRFHDRRLTAAQRADAGMQVAQSHLLMGRYAAGLAQLDGCLEIDPAAHGCLYAKAVVLQRLGRVPEAISALRDALAAGVPEAFPKLLLLESARAIEGSEPVAFDAGGRRIIVDPQKVEDFLNVANLAVRDGIPGFAVATLERAQDRFPGEQSIRRELAKLYELYGEWQLAEALYAGESGESYDEDAKAHNHVRTKIKPFSSP